MHHFSTLLIAIFAAVITAWFMTPIDRVQPNQQSAYERVIKSSTLRCGYNFYPPAIMKNEQTGQLEGFVVDVMNEIARVAEIKIEWTAVVDWGMQIEDVRSAKVDAFCAGSWASANRAKFVLQSDAFSYQGMYAFVRADDTRFDADLTKANSPEVKISVFENTPVITAQRENFPNATAVSMPAMATNSDGLLQVVSKKTDITLIDKGEGLRFMKNNPGKVKLASAKPIRVHGNTIVMDNNDFRLYTLINSAIRELQNAGVLDKLADKWNARYPESFLPPKALYQKQ